MLDVLNWLLCAVSKLLKFPDKDSLAIGLEEEEGMGGIVGE